MSVLRKLRTLSSCVSDKAGHCLPLRTKALSAHLVPMMKILSATQQVREFRHFQDSLARRKTGTDSIRSSISETVYRFASALRSREKAT